MTVLRKRPRRATARRDSRRKDATQPANLELVNRFDRMLPVWMRKHPRTYAVVCKTGVRFIPRHHTRRLIQAATNTDTYIGYVPGESDVFSPDLEFA